MPGVLHEEWLTNVVEQLGSVALQISSADETAIATEVKELNRITLHWMRWAKEKSPEARLAILNDLEMGR